MVQIYLIFPISLYYGDVLVEPFLRLRVNELNSLAIMSQSLHQSQSHHLRHSLQMSKKYVVLKIGLLVKTEPSVLAIYFQKKYFQLSVAD